MAQQTAIKRGTAWTIGELAAGRRIKHNGDYKFDFKNSIDLILSAVAAGSAITIIGDYDCDGVCASAIMCMALNKLGANPRVRLPLRFSEGYGINSTMIDEVESGLIITVDNGITAIDEIAAARAKGLKVLVTDHHLPSDENGSPLLPDADCIIDPHVEQICGIDGYDFAGYCGAGISLKLAEELLRVSGLVTDPDFIEKLYALAATATVADQMEIIEDNHRICRRGISAMAQGRISAGLSALLKVCRIDFSDGLPAGVEPWMLISTDTLGFRVGPCINAPSRMVEGECDFKFVKPGGDGAKISYACLTNENPARSAFYADILNNYNLTRKQVSDEGLKNALNEIEKRGMQNDSPLVLDLPGLKSGIVGNISGALSQELGVPVVLLTNDESGSFHGSCRSPDGYHLREALDKVSHLLLTYGGHAGAAGLSLLEENIPALREALLADGGYRVEKSSLPEYDLELDITQLESAIKGLQTIAPFGPGNPEPVFLLRDVPMNKASILKGAHIRVQAPGLNAIGFNLTENGRFPTVASGATANMLGKLEYNYFRGSASVQFRILQFV